MGAQTSKAQTKRVLRVSAVMQQHCVIKALDWVGECRSVCVGGGGGGVLYTEQTAEQTEENTLC